MSSGWISYRPFDFVHPIIHNTIINTEVELNLIKYKEKNIPIHRKIKMSMTIAPSRKIMTNF